MAYSVKEIFYTLQGEGAQTGHPAVFCRFTGCNLWSGREEDRSQAQCQFCDTDFVGTDGSLGGKYKTASQLAKQIAALWPIEDRTRCLTVLTGGEPLLQLDAPLINALHAQNFRVAVESNGTIAAPPGIDWLCISPKAGTPLIQKSGQELKVVWPQSGIDLCPLENLSFDYFFLQPMDGTEQEKNIKICVDYCMQHPQWHLSLQTHKIAGLK